jgi:DNA-binding CsgD family transcriptional regulator/pimeloyl-ACP methyl ester carboxylesterase
MQQAIRYLTTGDGARLAWASMGGGPVLVKAANWLSHLEYDLQSPIWRHWYRFFGEHYRLLRYDERGCGMSGGDARHLTLDHWLGDLESMVDAAVKHPQRVSRLLLYGAYARGPYERGNEEAARLYRAIIDIARVGWADQNPVFRQVFTSRFIPDATEAQVHWFNELVRTTTTAEAAAALLEARARINVTALLDQVRVPTLVLHARQDGVVPLEEGRLLAAGIPGARFVELESRNHVLLEHEPAWQRFRQEVLAFLGGAPQGVERLAELTPREREIVAGLVAGRTNAQIAATLFISDKTVRNALTRIYEKLGVQSRTQAMALLQGSPAD